MGTWRTFDVRGSRDDAHRRSIVDAALESGVTLFDSSPMYGEAERVLAAALGRRRSRAIVATKVWSTSRSEGLRQIERSLAFFGGRVEVFQIHNLEGWRHHLPVLEALREEGRIDVIGATHHRHDAFPELMRVMKTGRIQQVQIPYHVLDRVAEREVLPLAAELGLGVLVMRPLGEGTLVRRSPSLDRLAPLRAAGIATWSQALLKWILSERRVHGVLPATSKVEHVYDNAATGDPPWLDAEQRDYVERVARGTVS